MMFKPSLIQTPSKRWAWVGTLPIQLAWRRKDRVNLTDKDVYTITYCGAPALFGYEGVSFQTKEEAEEAMKKYNSDFIK